MYVFLFINKIYFTFKKKLIDMTFTLITGICKWFSKIINKPRTINATSNHQAATLKEILKCESKIIYTKSSNESTFNQIAPFYYNILEKCQ